MRAPGIRTPFAPWAALAHKNRAAKSSTPSDIVLAAGQLFPPH